MDLISRPFKRMEHRTILSKLDNIFRILDRLTNPSTICYDTVSVHSMFDIFLLLINARLGEIGAKIHKILIFYENSLDHVRDRDDSLLRSI